MANESYPGQPPLTDPSILFIVLLKK